MSNLPDPMTPEYCDLRGYDFMPLFGHKLFASELYTEASDGEFRAAIRLWWAAWNQVPAGSLPNSDRALATLADFGRDVEAWQRVKERALHGFILCSDGRLYHPMLCQEALDSYEERLRKSKRRAADKERLQVWREMRRKQDGNKPDNENETDNETEVKRVSTAYQSEIGNACVHSAARRDRDRDSNTLTTFVTPENPSSPDRAQDEIARIEEAAPKAPNARDQLWVNGLAVVRHSTGLPDKRARSLMGRWLKDCKDSAETLNAILTDAADTRPIEFEAWVTQAVKARCNPHAIQQQRARAWSSGVMVEGR